MTTRKINICHVIDASTANPLLLNSIRQSDASVFEHIVVTLDARGGLHEEMESIGIRALSVGRSSRLQSPIALWRLFRLFRREGVDIVQTHLFDSSLIGLTAACLARVPLKIFTGHHSHEVPLYRRPLLTFVDSLSGRFLSDKTIAPSANMKRIFIEEHHIPGEKVEVLHHGFQIDGLRGASADGAAVRQELGIEGKVVLGAVGRLFWVKNYRNLIGAFARLASVRDDVVLLIAGEGGERETLEDLIAELAMQDRVRLLGRRSDIESVMASFDVFVHPALAESFGMVFVEAMAAGKPVLSTRVGIAEDVVRDGENGLLIPAMTEESIFQGLRDILGSEEKWSAMGAVNLEMSKMFDISSIQARCDRFYSDALARARSRGN